MPSLSESLASSNLASMPGALDAGVEKISQNQVITFTKYVRRVLPLDGFVYWVRIDKAAGYDNEPITVDIKGSLHYTTTKTTNDQGVYGQTHVTFTSEDDAIQNSAADLLIGSFQDFIFAFATTGHYQQAGIWHYNGIAVLPNMMTQVIDDPSQIKDDMLIVSNSIPLWLDFAAYQPFYVEELVCPCPIYPVGQSPYDLKPPYATISVDRTQAIAGSPYFDDSYSSYLLSQEVVTIKAFGLNNSQSSDFRDGVYAWSYDTNLVGLMNAPVFSDDRVPSAELLTLAMAKTMRIEISYIQKDVRNIARQYIKQAIPSYPVRDYFTNTNVRSN